MAVLEFNNVTKVYNAKSGSTRGMLTAVKDVSFTVDAGEIVGFIGPNGAGKSTAIKMITGLANPTQGKITIMGHDITKERVQAISNVGAIIENPDMYIEWTAEENLKYFSSLTSMKELGGDSNYSEKEIITHRIQEVLNLVGLYERRKDKVKKFSLGMKQRLGIAQALLNKPKLLILDEPANGLDPSGIKEMRDIVTHLAKNHNMAILISSHQLAEMQLMCDRFLIINKGEIIATPSLNDLKGSRGDTVIVTTDNVQKAAEIVTEKFELNVRILDKDRMEINGEVNSGDIVKELIMSGINIKAITQKELSLEEFFMAKTQADKEVKNVW